MALNFPTALIAFVIWVAAAKLSHISAVGALAAYGSLPLVAWWRQPGTGFVPFCAALALLVLVRHKDNINQLLAARRSP